MEWKMEVVSKKYNYVQNTVKAGEENEWKGRIVLLVLTTLQRKYSNKRLSAASVRRQTFRKNNNSSLYFSSPNLNTEIRLRRMFLNPYYLNMPAMFRIKI